MVFLLSLLACPAAARAGEPDPAPASPASPWPSRIVGRERKVTHESQIGFSVMPGAGYRIIVPYQEGKYCGDRSGAADKRVCTNFPPAFLDLQAALGLTSSLDLVADLRLGLADDFTHHRQLAIAPGVRFWADADRPLKLYATVQIAWDHSGQTASGVSTDDLAFRNANGVMYDFVKNFGLFVQFGETFGFVRWFRCELDAGAGIQLRFP